MPIRPTFRLAIAALCLALAAPAAADSIGSSLGPLQVTRVAQGFDEPWALGFLPDGRFLVTERAGQMTLFAHDGTQGRAVTGLPPLSRYVSTRSAAIWLSSSLSRRRGSSTVWMPPG